MSVPSAVTSGFSRSPWPEIGSSKELYVAMMSSLQLGVF